jgi:kynurenine formamidase
MELVTVKEADEDDAQNGMSGSSPGTSGWGRWGLDDERGAANTVGPTAIARGLASVFEHRSVSLGAPIIFGRGPDVIGRPAPQHHMARDGGDYAAGLPERGGFGFSDDLITVATHGVTHLDALSHIWQDGLMYNGYSSSTVTSRGAARCGIDTVGPIVTRGVLLDLVPEGQRWMEAGEYVGIDRLRDHLQRVGVTLEAGDALLIRTGWLDKWRAGMADESAWPGLDADCAEWLTERDLVLIGADNVGVEAFPSSDPLCHVPLHVSLLRGHGVFFCELLDLADLASAQRSTFLFVVAPLNLVGGVGSPVAPVAVL